MKSITRFGSLFFFVCFTIPLVSESTPKPIPQTLRLLSENDVLLLSDREYTNGIRAEYGVYKTLWTPSGILLKGLGLFFPKALVPMQEYSGLALSHAIYTPQNFFSSDISFGERPYSSYGMFSSTNSFFFSKSSFSLETEFGQMGPIAQGKQIQAIIHSLTNSPLPQGWDKQVPNQNLYQLNLEHKFFWNENLGIQTSTRFGNLDTSIRWGPIFRWGKIHSPVTPNLGANDTSPVFYSTDSEFYFFFHPSIKLQSINATLGNGNASPFPNSVNLSSGDTSFAKEGRLYFVGEPLYNSLVEERSSSALTRFLFFQQFLSQERSLSLNYLIFNTIFNGASVPDLAFRLTVLQEISRPDFKRENYPGIEFFVYDTLFRDPTQGASLFSKWIAYQYFFRNGIPENDVTAIGLLLLYNEENAPNTYKVDLQRWQGKLSSGFFLQKDPYFAKFGIEFASLEYKVQEGLLPFHRYASIQLGIYF